MGSIEIEFDYLPSAGDDHARAALGIVIELALCAAQQSGAAPALRDLLFGAPLVLDEARRCRATCDLAVGLVQVTSSGLGLAAVGPAAVVHLSARLGAGESSARRLHGRTDLGAARELTALAAPPSSAGADAWSLRGYERGLCAELASRRSDWHSYAVHPVVATYAHELAALLPRPQAERAGSHPLRARELCALSLGARVTRVRVLAATAADEGVMLVAETEGGIAWYVDGLELAGARDSSALAPSSPSSSSGGAAAQPAGMLARSLLAVSGPQRRQRCTRALRERIARVLDVAPTELSAQAALKDLGLRSLTATQLAAEIGVELGRAVSPTLLFDHPTLTALVDAVLQLLDDAPRAVPAARSAARADRSIAIVGMACRTPGGAKTPEQLWQLLCEQRDAVGSVSSERIALAPQMARHELPAAFLDDIERFDAGFFGLSEREACATDPQHRLLLELAWEALERAGIVPSSLIGANAGVFVSAAPHGYGRLVAELDAFTVVGNEPSAAAGRLSYFFGLRGPSMCVDAACASSLVAICLASDSLRRGEIDLAIVGGVNLMLEPLVSEGLLAAGVLSSATSRCRAFDAAADGYVRGEACGVLVLRRADDAARAGEPVQAVIRGYAVAHGGRTNGLGAPSREAQLEVIERALADAGLAARDVGYVEAHGTGTALGDAIELQALRDSYGAVSGREQPVVVGAIKANIGHSELAAGVISTIKSVLVVGRGELPPQLHVSQPTAAIDWGSAGVTIARERQVWPAPHTRRIAGVNALGMSGTYAHLLLEAPALATPNERATAVPDDREVAGPHLIAVHGASSSALRAQAEAYARHLEAGGSAMRLAVTTQHHRQRLAHRAAVIGDDAAELQAALGRLARGEAPSCAPSERPKLAFLYSGFGTHYAGMGAELLARCAPFRAAIEDCDRALVQRLPCSLLDVMERSTAAEQWLRRSAVSQPAVVALEIALTRQWQSWGVTADVVIGHSLGELSAAHVAGVLSLEDALMLAHERGRLMDELPGGGAMAAVEAPRDVVEAVIGSYPGSLWLAAANSPTQLVISGTIDSVKSACARFERAGLRVRALQIPFAAHSGLLAPALPAFEQAVSQARCSAPSLALISSMTGARFRPEMGSARYFREQLRAPVEFARGMQTLSGEGVRAYLEIGPHSALIGPAAQCVEGSDKLFVASMVRERDPLRQLLDAASELYAAGVELEWNALSGGRGAHDPSVPAYAFQRRRYWLSKPASAGAVREECAAQADDLPARAEHHSERLLRFPESEVITRLERLMRAELRRILDPEPDDAAFERDLAELGLSSLGAVQLRSCLQRWVGVPIPLALITGDKTVRTLAVAAWAQRTRAA